MKVLHIGWGFIPWRVGGLIEYAEDLMNIQADKGWNVSYFFSGRYYPFTKTKLKKWRNGKIIMLEIINSPIFHAGELGTLYPELDLEEEEIENIFREVLNQLRPNIIHIQELAGLPTSLIDIIKDEYDIPLVMTLQDYFLLCPTLKLFKNNSFCLENNLSKNCAICCMNAPLNYKFLIISTLMYDLKRFHLFKPAQKIRQFLRIFPTKKPQTIESSLNIMQINKIPQKNIIYQKRRNINIERLKKIDLLISISYKVEEIYRNFTGTNKIVTLHSTVKHLELINPKTLNIKIPIKFATLAGCSTVPKGSEIIKEAIEKLNKKGFNSSFELHIWGGLDNNIKKILNFDNVCYHGNYAVENLDDILNDVDVGIMPSMWEEAYGFTGIEFLAKGIPVIGNKRGGIVDYVITDKTGWLNKTASSEELASIMEYLIEDPEKITNINRKIIKNKKLIKSMDTHFNEINQIYLNLINREGSDV